MNCYNFESNISAYIENELKQTERQSFNEHKQACSLCEKMFSDVSVMLNRLSELKSVSTSNQFIYYIFNFAFKFD